MAHQSLSTSSVAFCDASDETPRLLLRVKVARIFTMGHSSTSMRCERVCLPSRRLKPLPLHHSKGGREWASARESIQPG